jgi:hypothetical protein
MKSSNKPDKAVRYADLGFRLVATVIASVGLGLWLDYLLPDWTPFFTLFFSISGVTGAMIWLVRTLS